MRTERRDRNIVLSDGVALSVSEYGSASTAEHTVVLLHGFCLDKSSWELQAEALANQWGDAVRVLAYDHRGHGQSNNAPMNSYTIKQLALDLADVLRIMRVQGPLTLAGHSMGGMTIMTYMGLPADSRPIDPDHTVLVATAAGRISHHGIGVLMDTPALGLIRKAARRSPERVADFVLRNLMHPLSGVLVRGMGSFDGEGKAQAALAAASINATPIRTKAGFLTALRDLNEYDSLDNIKGRVTILSGGNDCLTPAVHAKDITSRVNSANTSSVARHVHFADSGHMILHDEPQAVSSALNLGIIESEVILDDNMVASIVGGALDIEFDDAEAS